MVRYSAAQLKTLARIKFNGLVYYYSGSFPMTHLNTPAPFSVRLHSATIRRLERTVSSSKSKMTTSASTGGFPLLGNRY